METTPATLGDAIALQSTGLQAWVMILVLTHFLAILFVVHKDESGWHFRAAPLLIVFSLILGGIVMEWIYQQVGYQRLLGVAHLICWLPLWVWIFIRFQHIGRASIYGKYLLLYLAIAGISMVLDTIDVIRYLLQV